MIIDFDPISRIILEWFLIWISPRNYHDQRTTNELLDLLCMEQFLQLGAQFFISFCQQKIDADNQNQGRQRVDIWRAL